MLSFRPVYYALMPLFVLLAATFFACIIGYGLILLSDNNLPLVKTISKTTQVLLVLSLFPALNLLGFNRKTLGFTLNRTFFKQLLQGAALGFISLLPVFIALYALGVHVIDSTKSTDLGFVLQKISLALFTAVLIALIEESLFRGVIFLSLKQKINLRAALVISSFYYAALHFLQTKTQLPANEISLWHSFAVALQAFANLLNPRILSAFAALFMVGIFLALLRERASLAWCIGCHSSWVLQIKLSKEFFNTDVTAPYRGLVSDYDGVIGNFVTVWLLLLVCIYLTLKSKLITKVSLY